MVFRINRRLERQGRWVLFLLLTMGWCFFAASLSTETLLAGVAILATALLQSWTTSSIPVLAYHSVSSDAAWLSRPDLTVPTKSFERQMQWIARKGYSTLSLDELHQRRSTGSITKKAIAITFDDGYLDNWVTVEPILKKYALSGTVFVSSGWIENGSQCRTQLTNHEQRELQWDGYLNKMEIRALSNGSTLNIQSHAHSHDTIFCSNHIDDFASPNHQPRWLTILLGINKFSWYRQDTLIPTGYPIFSAGQSLAVSAFYPNPDLISQLTGMAAEAEFTDKHGWQDELHMAAIAFKSKHNSLGKVESETETRDRWNKELKYSKLALEKLTGKKVEHLCWPKDAYCEASQQLAFDSGYKSVTAGQTINDHNHPELVSRIYVEACGIPSLDLAVLIMNIWLAKGHFWVWPASMAGNRLIRYFMH